MSSYAASFRNALAMRVTLIEILLRVACFAVVVYAVQIHLAARHRYGCVLSPIKSTKISAQDLQSIADGWRVDHPNECPTVQRLKDDQQMSVGSSTRDVWGTPWKISCCGSDTSVMSSGPDQQAGTKDDILFPPERWCP
jgi:general secretion pathway protein G